MNTSKNKIQIRPLTKDDFKQAALLMSYAFKDKLLSLKKYNEYDVCDFMLAGGVFSEHSLEGYYVAIVDDEVAGILHLDTYIRHKNKIDAPLKVKYIIKKFGFIRSLIGGISFLFLEHRLQKDEMIVDFIAVHPELRGQGIGGELLDFGEETAKNSEGIFRYTLRVIGQNTDAKRLYERKGFSVVKIKQQHFAALFTGVKLYYHMEKKI